MADKDPQAPREPGFATLCVHGKKHLDKHEVGRPIRAVSTPIFQSSTFAFENVAHGAAVFRGEDPSYVYTRLGNPTQTALETEMAYLEQGEAALALASGMAAATTAVLNCCRTGDHIVAGDTLYGGTHQLFTQTLPRLGIDVTEVPAQDPKNFAKAITKRTKLVYLETPANPTLVLTDIAAVAEIAHRHGARCWWTTPSARPTCRTRCCWARTSCCTRPPSTSAATATPSPASWSAGRTGSWRPAWRSCGTWAAASRPSTPGCCCGG